MFEFLKPTVKKIILFFILFLILPITTLPMFGTPEICGSHGCTYYHWIPLGGLRFIFGLIDGGNNAFMITSNYIYKGGTLIIVSYLLSCLIIYFTDKFSGKSKI